ncbi:MAG TPA: hypothetical protein VKB67_14630 [Rhizomicrobium sp.]|nr:hypothetical protein [Rhizomicrobium sp.]
MKPDYSAMAVNERLFAAGLLDSYDAAVRAGDTALMVRLLGEVDLAHEAQHIVAAVMAHPTRAGRLKP